MATTPYSLRTITVAGRTYRWRQQLSEGWNGFHVRTVLRIQIQVSDSPSAMITAYAMNSTAPLMRVDGRVVRAIIREAMRQGWRPLRGRRLTLVDLKQAALSAEA